MQDESYQPKQQEVFSAEEAKGLEGEIDFSNPSSALLNLAQNPGKLAQQFSLSPNQVSNVKGILVGGATGASVKFLGKAVGDELAAIMGAAASAYVAKKLFGR